MSDQQKTSKKAGIVLISSIITATNQALTLIVLARILDKAVLGDVAKLIMVYKTAVILGNFGFNDNPYYFLPKLKPASWGSFLYQCMRILFFSGLITGAISFFLFWYFFHNVFLSVLMIGVITLELTTSLIPDYLVAAGRAKASSAFNLFMSVLNVGMIITVCLLFEDKILFLAYGFLLYNIIKILFAFLVLGKSIRHDREALPKGLLREQLDFGIPLGLSSLTFKLNKQLDNYVVAFFFSPDLFAEYSVGSWEIPMLLKIPFSITAVYLPKYTRLFDENKIAELREKWLQVTEKIIVMIVPITTFFLIYAKEIIHMAFGEQYQIAVAVFQIYTLTLYTRVASYTGLMKSFGDSRFILFLSSMLFIVNLIFNLIFIQIFGIYGAAIGTLIANLLMLCIGLRRISVKLRTPIRDLMPYQFHFYTLLISLVAAGLTKWAVMDLWLNPFIDNIFIRLLLGIVVYLILFVSFGSWSKLLKKEDRNFILDFLKIKKNKENV
jgi:O-antigen/teichoic acid export membrane protein